MAPDAVPAHLAPLERWRLALMAGGRAVPHFDPADGGVGARLLILLETPGAGMTAADRVTADNRSGTARNLTRFLGEAGIARADRVIWNVVPWIVQRPGVRNRPLTRGEIAEGAATVPALLDLLPALRAVVLAGRPAAAAGPAVAAHRPGVALLEMPHPSPTIVCTSPAVGERIRAALARAAAVLEE